MSIPDALLGTWAAALCTGELILQYSTNVDKGLIFAKTTLPCSVVEGEEGRSTVPALELLYHRKDHGVCHLKPQCPRFA